MSKFEYVLDGNHICHPNPPRAEPPSWSEICARREAWAKARGLKLASPSSNCTLHKVAPFGIEYPPSANKRLCRMWWHYEVDALCPRFHYRIFDHVDYFVSAGAPRLERFYVLTTQPYYPPLDLLEDFRQWCAERHMVVVVSWEGWHNPYACPLIEVWPEREALRQAIEERKRCAAERHVLRQVRAVVWRMEQRGD